MRPPDIAPAINPTPAPIIAPFEYGIIKTSKLSLESSKALFLTFVVFFKRDEILRDIPAHHLFTEFQACQVIELKNLRLIEQDRFKLQIIIRDGRR